MASAIDHAIRQLAQGRCEYCRMPESSSRLSHVLDHIIARQHFGRTERGNLALCCGQCNAHKGPNISGVDPETGAVVQLFHPRSQEWKSHFRYEGAVLIGKTPTGRATISVLAINDPLRSAARQALLEIGVIFDPVVDVPPAI